MAVDPRTLDKVVRRVVFARAARCSVRVIRTNQHVGTGETWTGYESCDEAAGYASVKKGKVHTRCEKHARSDAKRWGVEIDENPAIEFRGKRTPLAIRRAGDPE